MKPLNVQFKTAKPQPLWSRGLRTLLQVVVFWGFFLFLVPWLISLAQARIGIAFFDPGPFRLVAVFAFCSFGLTALYCAWLFVRYGLGTPLPLDQTTQLVVLGPYRHVRNPMAICGISQGVCVGMFLGSWPVMAYAVAGAFAWQWLARPMEESDLDRRHGDAYREYRDTIPIWIPRIQAFPKRLAGEPTERDQAADA